MGLESVRTTTLDNGTTYTVPRNQDSSIRAYEATRTLTRVNNEEITHIEKVLTAINADGTPNLSLTNINSDDVFIYNPGENFSIDAQNGHANNIFIHGDVQFTNPDNFDPEDRLISVTDSNIFADFLRELAPEAPELIGIE